MNENDKRKRRKEYETCKREFKKGVIATIIYILCSTILSYTLGYKQTFTDMTLILGFPAWIFYSVLIPWILIVIYTVYFAFKMED
ncbi:putative membrane protein YesL [Peptoniphilus olsenii]|uniref:Membrane protein YesL n=1 Tax=Peptoniphilus olsenii TaxID=411570 RepID=A0ABV2JAH5_9FIRM